MFTNSAFRNKEGYLIWNNNYSVLFVAVGSQQDPNLGFNEYGIAPSDSMKI